MGRRKSNQKEVVAPGSGPVDPRQMYNDIATHNFNQHTIQQLELSQTLETVLWPNYASEQGKEATLLIVILINEKFRQNASVWEIFGQSSDNFSLLFHNITRLALDKSLTITERIFVLRFLINSFNAVETELLRNEIKRYVSMPVWVCLSQKRLESEFSQVPKLKKLWKKMEKSDKTLSSTQLERVNFERRFIANLVLDFFGCLNEIPSIDNIKMLEKEHEQIVKYCERFLEFLIDLETLLPTRRFTQVILDDMHITTIARLSNLFSRSEDGKLFRQLLKNLKFYLKFEIDHITGEALNDFQITMRHMKKFSELQKTIFGLYGDDANFRPIYLASVSSMDSRADFLKRFMLLKDEDLINICNHLALGMENNEQLEKICSLCPQFLTKKDIVLEVLVDHFEKIESQIKVLNSLPLYPTEEVIWDENLVPSDYNENCLALPKLKIQFLTMHDYLLRNFHLFRLESAYQIRQDIESAIAHMKPWRAENGSTIFGGWARMSIAIDSFTITEVGKANIGESKPSRVKAEVVVNLNVKRPIKREWESLRKHDVCFLITVQPKAPPGTKYLFSESLLSQLGNVYVRGCEIEGMLDPTGRLIDDIALASGERPTFTSDYRTYRVWLDNNQYHMDTKSEQLEKVSKAHQQEDVYGTFNILMRRKPNENNFKAVLETIRDLMNIKFVVPDWLHDVLLGYGEPDSAHYTNLSINQEIFPVLDFYDTFLDLEHIKKSFGDYKVLVDGDAEPSPSSLFKLKIDNDTKVVTVYPYVQSLFGPSRAQVKRNLIQFTPTQVEAIRSGIQHGLTMVVGPPGTGKTDLAVQIISNLYHNHPDQRTLIVTHSNQALNAIFEKIMNLNIEERHLLRLGRGEEELETEKDFSRYGRVNYVLAKRLQLLDEVARLAKSLSLSTDFAYTCETAGYFFLYNVLAKWEAFVHKMNTLKQDPQQLATAVQTNFPFAEFFKDVQPLFVRENFEQNFEVAKECFQSIRAIFSQLEEFKPFEILRNGSERANYLLLKEAKIIAMTCTHAALKRKDLATLGFQYDNIIMEESAQILEIETFIPLLLQNPEFGHNRLKRWIMIGDHRQLPPVIQNQSFQKFSNMEQSLFTRFVRLGVPTVDLDKQARARPSISALYNWRYQNLGDLEIVHSLPEFNRPNPGFQFDYQLINVEDFNKAGETEPLPHFFQNLAEAEYVVAMFMYMRLLGYPSEKITILTTYNGQKFLIRDVIEQRCATNPFMGRPHKITTVDKFQGQQNDYILLSLVRTKTVGHIRDIRRLTVALSRARLGLYVFARQSLFASCYELQKTFKMFADRPNTLKLIPSECYLQGEQDFVARDNSPMITSIQDMPEMVKFVFDFYPKQMERIQQNWPEWFDSIMNPNKDKTMEEKEEEEEEVEDVKMEKKTDASNVAEEENGQEELFEKLNENDTGMDDDVEMPEAEDDEKVTIPEDIPV